MRLAVLLKCHRNPFMANALMEALRHDCVDFYVHVDAKSSIADGIEARDDIHVLPAGERVEVRWGDVSQVEATLALMRGACAAGDYDHLWLMSGQDWPLWPAGDIVSFLGESGGRDFLDVAPSLASAGVRSRLDKRCEVAFPGWIVGRRPWQRAAKRAWVTATGGWGRTLRPFARRGSSELAPFYFGSQWWCLRGDVVRWMLGLLEERREYLDFYSLVLCPEESIFQTLYMRSPYAGGCDGHLLYEVWDGGSSPRTLGLGDVGAAVASGRPLSRKWDFEGPDDRTLKALCERVATSAPRGTAAAPAADRKE